MKTRLAPGDVDLWTLYDVSRGETLPCPSARRFLYYLASESTRTVRAMLSVPAGYADMVLMGPITDDAIYDPADKGACLTVEYRLTKDEVWECLSLEEREWLVKFVREKRMGFSFDLWTKAMRIARVR